MDGLSYDVMLTLKMDSFTSKKYRAQEKPLSHIELKPQISFSYKKPEYIKI